MSVSVKNIKGIISRELVGYFTSPIAYVFIIIYLLLSGFFSFAAFPFGDFLNTNDPNLGRSFFIFHPWLYLILIPAVSMRLWAEEYKSGTSEILFTMPISITEAVIGKYLASLLVVICALGLTFPIVLTANWLGNPDNNIILTGYIGSILLAASFLALGSMISTLSKNQLISFIITVLICLFLILVGHPAVTDFFIEWAPVQLITFFSQLSVFPHFEAIQKGIIDFRDILYFSSVIIFGLTSSIIILNSKR